MEAFYPHPLNRWFEMHEDDGRPRDVGWWHTDPARRTLVERYAAVRLAAMPVTSPVVRALGGETVVSDAADVVDLLPEGEARDLLQLLGTSCGVPLRLRGRGRILGALRLYLDGGRRPSAAELATAREVADRAGLALDNSWLFSQQRQLAETLQRSLLNQPMDDERARSPSATPRRPRRPGSAGTGTTPSCSPPAR